MTEELRQRFEDWAVPRYDVTRVAGGAYRWDYANDLWQCWQAASAQSGWRPIPEGWTIERKGDALCVFHGEVGGYAATDSLDNIAATILYYLAKDLLQHSPPPATQPAPPPRGNLPGLCLDSGEFVPAEELK